MSDTRSPDELETAIGYPFCDKDLLVTALTRTMYANEHNGTVGGSMDALATVGDAVLGTVVVARLYENGTRDKGTLTQGKILGVNRDRTRAFATAFRLEEYIRWGKGEEKNRVWLQGNQAFDTAFEALIGAVFLDAKRSGRDGLAVVGNLLERIHFFG